jgi:shikimate kinase
MAERIVLIGFMGAGKSTVGPILAARLGFEWVDTDAVIEKRAGAPVARLFHDRGEAAFRSLESEVLEELTQRTRIVIATGGGAPVQERNREFFTRGARVFHLRVSLESVWERTGSDPRRPLLSRGDAEVRHLFEARARIYESLGVPVETDGRSPVAVAEEIMSLLTNPTGKPAPGGSV